MTEDMSDVKRRGRPKKQAMPDDERLEDLLFRAYDFYEEDGQVKMSRNSTPLTLDDTAFLLWNIEGRKSKKPLSKMMVLKTEQSALRKLRAGLEKYGIKSFDDVFDSKYRTFANTKYGATDVEE